MVISGTCIFGQSMVFTRDGWISLLQRILSQEKNFLITFQKQDYSRQILRILFIPITNRRNYFHLLEFYHSDFL